MRAQIYEATGIGDRFGGYARSVSESGSSERDDERRTAQRRRDQDAPGAFVDDEDADEVPEPNEPA